MANLVKVYDLNGNEIEMYDVSKKEHETWVKTLEFMQKEGILKEVEVLGLKHHFNNGNGCKPIRRVVEAL